jgi:C-terminal processing protease CtpA/Prc
MKQIFFIIAVCFSTSVFGQNNAKPSKSTIKLEKEISTLIQKQSLFRDSLDWKKIKAEAKALPLTDNDSISQKVIFDFYRSKLREVGDKHTSFIAHQVIAVKKTQPIAKEPKGTYLGEEIGYLNITPCSNFDEQKDLDYANIIKSIIQKMDGEHTINKWIIDLRHNTGGNVWPMLAGLNALIDDGRVGYFVYPQSKVKTELKIANGELYLTDLAVNKYKATNKPVKIALLIDGLTASSGEMATVALLGLPNVKTFGQTSAGYTTVNMTVTLSNGSMMNLATGFYADRTGKEYRHNIVPDVVVNDTSNTINDGVVDSAKKWLLQ